MRTAGEQEKFVDNLQSQDGGSFKIKASAKAFKILSDNLYSNKPRAVVRELCCNAFDAHVAAGKSDIPFEITMPGPLQACMTIRDFGPGLTHEEVLEVYPVYFESTKSSSNDYIGALGLGAKSPFCYTPSFQVISYNGGKKRVYSCHVSDEGFPRVDLMIEEDSAETGLQIDIPILKKDYDRFAQELQSVLMPFKVKPKIIGADFNIENYADHLIWEGEGWRVVSENSLSQDHHVVFNYGQVEYPLRSEVAREFIDRLVKEVESSTSAASSKYYGGTSFKEILENRILKNQHMFFIIDVFLGLADVAASREDFSYDAQTKENLYQRFKETILDLQESLRTKVNESPNLYSKIQVLGEYSKFFGSSMGYLREIATFLDNGDNSLIPSYEMNVYNTPVTILDAVATRSFNAVSRYRVMQQFIDSSKVDAFRLFYEYRSSVFISIQNELDLEDLDPKAPKNLVLKERPIYKKALAFLKKYVLAMSNYSNDAVSLLFCTSNKFLEDNGIPYTLFRDLDMSKFKVKGSNTLTPSVGKKTTRDRFMRAIKVDIKDFVDTNTDKSRKTVVFEGNTLDVFFDNKKWPLFTKELGKEFEDAMASSEQKAYFIIKNNFGLSPFEEDFDGDGKYANHCSRNVEGISSLIDVFHELFGSSFNLKSIWLVSYYSKNRERVEADSNWVEIPSAIFKMANSLVANNLSILSRYMLERRNSIVRNKIKDASHRNTAYTVLSNFKSELETTPFWGTHISKIEEILQDIMVKVEFSDQEMEVVNQLKILRGFFFHDSFRGIKRYRRNRELGYSSFFNFSSYGSRVFSSINNFNEESAENQAQNLIDNVYSMIDLREAAPGSMLSVLGQMFYHNSSDMLSAMDTCKNKGITTLAGLEAEIERVCDELTVMGSERNGYHSLDAEKNNLIDLRSSILILKALGSEDLSARFEEQLKTQAIETAPEMAAEIG